jgi:LacI family sucrose operon transcriptional repressor
MARLDDVAKLAGVSKTTASRVLNKRGYISSETRDKVYYAMQELNYHTDKAAKGLLEAGSSTIGLLVPDICYSYFSELAFDIEAELSKHGYRMLLCNMLNSKKFDINSLEIFQKGPIDGLILCNYPLQESEIISCKIPIISVDRYLGHGISTVSSDYPSSGHLAAELLIRNGCKRVLQTVGSGSQSTPWNERHQIFAHVLEEHGVTCYTHIRDALRVSDFAYNRQVIGEQFDKYPDIDGYFANDVSAAAALKEASARGMVVPRDLKIISCDGSRLTEMTTPQITTIKQPVDRIAAWAVDTLCKLIKDPKLESCDVQLGVDLIERETTLP